MGKKLLQQALQQAYYYVLAYFTHYLFPIIKDTFNEAKESFIEKLWESVKIQVTSDIQTAVEYVECLFESSTYQEKEKAIIDTLFKNIELPLVLRPFKSLMKKILRDKLHQLISKYPKGLSSKP
jgi:transcriptional regulator CtsR